MTLPNDSVRIHMVLYGSPVIPISKLGLEWPPPERMVLCTADEEGIVREPVPEDESKGLVLKRVMMSQLTEKQADHPNIARCAEYRYEKELEKEQS
jgi:hypothetical protein